ncbi:unnamed protein product, partial [Ectocarpus sp. 12 AP-2014]
VLWDDRIAAAIGLSGTSRREVSLKAKLGVNYVSQILRNGHLPDGKRLGQICKALDISPEWVVSGFPPNPKLDSILAAVSPMPAQQRFQFYEILNKADEVPISRIDQIAEGTVLSSSDLQHALREASGATNVESKASIAVGNPTSNVDATLFAKAYDFVLSYENDMLTEPGSREARLKLARLIY